MLLLRRRCLSEESPRTDEALRHSAVTRVKLNPDKDEREEAENRQGAATNTPWCSFVYVL